MVWEFREDCKGFGVWTVSRRKGEDRASRVSRNNRHKHRKDQGLATESKLGYNNTTKIFKGVKSRYFKAYSFIVQAIGI